MDVEGTKDVKRMINLLAITVNLYHEIDADPSGSGSKTDRVRKQQMLINMHKVNRCTNVNGVVRMFSW